MIAAWMLFAIELSALLFISAWIAERALRQTRRPVRGVWIAAIAGANLLPLILLKLPSISAFADKFAMSVAPDGWLSRLSNSLVALWVCAAIIGLIICATAVWRMGRTRTGWKHEHVDNMPVLVSHDVGPALVGVMQYSIVVPQWACLLEQDARRLLLAHEREHARKFDPMLLTVAALAVVLAPWNVFNWLFFRRLHLAVELDCDQRVLRTHPDTRSYGALLLDVAERVLPSVMPAAAFVEHGASLETRIDAMSEKRKSFQSLRVASGLALSLVFAAAACFTPRPYAIIIVNPPAAAAAPSGGPVLAADQSQAQTGGPVLAKDQSQAQLSSILSAAARQAARAESAAAKAVPAAAADEAIGKPSARQLIASAREAAEAGILPVAPSAVTSALDEAENNRMRTIVAKNAPRALGSFARGDSALMLLLNDNGDVLKQKAVSLVNAGKGVDPMHVFARIFIQPDVNAIGSASRFIIDRGANNEPLQTPLTLFTAYQTVGLPTARTREDIAPTSDDILAVVRARHPGSFTDRSDNRNVIMMLFDTNRELLRSAIVPFDSLSDPLQGDHGSTWRKLFGTFMDGGSIIDRGSLVHSDANMRQGRPLYVVYGTMLMKSELSAFERLLQNKRRNWTFGGASSRSAGARLGGDQTDARLRSLVETRIPDAYGNWSRADSAVVFLFDANDQLVARRAGPIPENRQMLPMADYISLRVLTIPAQDIETVGWTYHLTSSSGRLLDKPLLVIWGRLNAELTRKRELAGMQKR